MDNLLNQKLSLKAVILIAVLVLGPVLGVLAYRSFGPQPVVIKSTSLEFVPLGDIEPQLVENIAKETAKEYGIPYRILPGIKTIPVRGYNSKRKQYDASALNQMLALKPLSAKTHRIGITEADIGVKGVNFVFGLAYPPERVAVMSLHRLRYGMRKKLNKSLLLDRGVKIAVHELGHTYGFEHCSNADCVMHYSDTAGGVDEGSKEFCTQCRNRIRQSD